MTQEFHISITPVGQNQYLVRTKQVAPTVPLAEAVVILPLMDWLTQFEQLVNEALNAVLAHDEKLGAEKSAYPFAPLQSKIINLGQQLYNGLFDNSLNQSWLTAQAIAQKEHQVLQLHLQLNEIVLEHLPWEIMHTGDRFLASDSAIEFCRYQTGEMPTSSLQQGIVKVLMAIAIPNSQDPLVLKQAATTLQAELGVFLTDYFSDSKTRCLATSRYSSTHFEDTTDEAITATELDFLDPEWDQVREQEPGSSDQPEMDFLSEDEWDQDEGYQEDSALVSDLFRQIAQEPPTAESRLSSDSKLKQLSEVDASADQIHSEPPYYTDNKSNLPTSASTPTTTNTSIERSPKSSSSNPHKSQKILPILQAVGVTAITFIGFWWFLQRQPGQIYPPTPSGSQSINDNLKIATTSQLQAIAIEHFHNGNLSTGILAVEELLNRGANSNAKTALNAVSAKTQTSEINFLRGRLEWQLIKAGDKNSNFDRVQSYWETAIKQKPSPRYYSALGFVYYTQGELNKANQAWFQALYLSEEQKANQTTSTSAMLNRDQLNAYAGLALVLTKSAENQPIDKQAKLLNEAIKLRQQVLTDDPVSFQPQTLSKTWLWTEKALQDWRSVLQHKN